MERTADNRQKREIRKKWLPVFLIPIAISTAKLASIITATMLTGLAAVKIYDELDKYDRYISC